MADSAPEAPSALTPPTRRVSSGTPSMGSRPRSRVSTGVPSLMVPQRSQGRLSVGAKQAIGISAKGLAKEPSATGMKSSGVSRKSNIKSKASIRQSRVSFAPGKAESVVNYYHSKHDDPALSGDPPAPRISKRISLTYLADPVITVYDQRTEEEQAGDGGDGDGAGRKFLHEYKDAPVKEEEEPLTMSQKMRYISQKLFRYKAMKVIQLACAIYIAVITLAPFPVGLRTPATGENGAESRGGFITDFIPIPSQESSDRRTFRGYVFDTNNLRAIVCASKFQLFLIGLTRISAYSMYPCKHQRQ